MDYLLVTGWHSQKHLKFPSCLDFFLRPWSDISVRFGPSHLTRPALITEPSQGIPFTISLWTLVITPWSIMGQNLRYKQTPKSYGLTNISSNIWYLFPRAVVHFFLVCTRNKIQWWPGLFIRRLISSMPLVLILVYRNHPHLTRIFATSQWQLETPSAFRATQSICHIW